MIFFIYISYRQVGKIKIIYTTLQEKTYLYILSINTTRACKHSSLNNRQMIKSTCFATLRQTAKDTSSSQNFYMKAIYTMHILFAEQNISGMQQCFLPRLTVNMYSTNNYCSRAISIRLSICVQYACTLYTELQFY